MREKNNQRTVYVEGIRNRLLDNPIGRPTIIFVEDNTCAISTGFKGLDSALDGGLYEGLYIVGAISSLGKTSFILQVADQIAASGRNVMIFSLEMSCRELKAKSISRLTYMRSQLHDKRDAKTMREIINNERRKEYGEKDRAYIGECTDAYKLSEDHINVIEKTSDMTVNGIRKEVEHCVNGIRADMGRYDIVRHKAPVVIIDYLQIIQPLYPGFTEKQAVDQTVSGLKRISRDYKIPVIGLSSLNGANYNHRISFEAFKDSGAIAYSSDVVIGMQPLGAGTTDFNVDDAREREPREIELVILKNRSGQVGARVEYEYYAKHNYFEERRTTQKRSS
jgi:replicative DNA helicase